MADPNNPASFGNVTPPQDTGRVWWVQSPYATASDDVQSNWLQIRTWLGTFFATITDLNTLASTVSSLATTVAGKVDATRQVATTNSLTGGGDLSANRTLQLVNDSSSPGNTKLYGTNGAGVRGWYDQPSSSAAGFASQRTATTTGNITNSDRNGVVYLAPTSGAQTFTFVRTSFVALDRVFLEHIGTQPCTISAGTDGFNTAGNDTFTLYPGEACWVVYEGTADPYWRVAIPGSLTLAANQYAALNNAGTALEARVDKREIRFSAPITANGDYIMWLAGDMPISQANFKTRTWSGTCDIKIQRADSGAPTTWADINGFTTAQSQTTTPVDRASTDTSGDGTAYRVSVTNASSLTGLCVTCEGVRTAN